ncbi:9683_t:CDS:1, partial [Dentiscutata erythropus]
DILKKIRTKKLDIPEVTKILSVEDEPSLIYTSRLLTSIVYKAVRQHNEVARQYNETKCVIDWESH